MFSEILDALDDYFKNDPDVRADCLVWLNKNGVSEAGEQLEHEGRCPKCGEELQFYTYREVHNELDYPCFETMTETLCPVCDWGYDR